jgi:hypothetical protein
MLGKAKQSTRTIMDGKFAALGIAFGVVIGAVTDHMGLGIALGLVFGVVLGSFVKTKLNVPPDAWPFVSVLDPLRTLGDHWR